MNRRRLGVIGGVATVTLLATALQGGAQAAPAADSAVDGYQAAKHKKDDRPNKVETKRRAMKDRAVEMVLNGDRKVQQRGGSKSVRVAKGQWVEYELEDQDEVLSFLVEFGDTVDPRHPDAPAGPVHNQIPEPDRRNDNSTYWTHDFDRQHYLDMFFNGLPDQNGESFKGVYEEMSSGRYTIDGDVSDWVQVDNHEASYGETESHVDMTRFIDDTADAWAEKQAAGGMTDAEMTEYLKTYDQWDRYDGDGDGNFDEPDGYIDHFQAIHAGEGEEAGAPSWAIWSHRWAVNQDGHHEDGIGPEGFPKFGGVEIGNTGLWIRDYTTEPENGGLGVFAHEYAHDLGIPDFYDTQGGENGTAFWTLMSSGSWLNHGEDAIGTTPNHMGPWEKLQLGWLDYEVASAGHSSKHKLGPAFHATKRPQAVVTVLPEHTVKTDVGEAYEGSDFFYSGTGDDRNATATSPEFTVPEAGQLTAHVKYEIEDDWDYAFVEVSTDGGETFTEVATNLSSGENPNGANPNGTGITGDSGGEWVPVTADLTEFAGQQAQVRFRMFNDAAVHEMGIMVDDIAVGTALSEGVEDGAPDWTLDEFVIAENGQTSEDFAHYYIAENRVYGGYDQVLEEGPYNFGWTETKPNTVERFPYQDGLLVWYWNTQYSDNNVSQHPGAGEILPVDARPKALKWTDGTVVRNRIQSFDATFGTQKTDRLSLHREVEVPKGSVGMTRLRVPSDKGIRVFNDTNPNRYYDLANPQGSVKVAGTGTTIRVVNENRKQGTMMVKVN